MFPRHRSRHEKPKRLYCIMKCERRENIAETPGRKPRRWEAASELCIREGGSLFAENQEPRTKNRSEATTTGAKGRALPLPYSGTPR